MHLIFWTSSLRGVWVLQESLGGPSGLAAGYSGPWYKGKEEEGHNIILRNSKNCIKQFNLEHYKQRSYIQRNESKRWVKKRKK